MNQIIPKNLIPVELNWQKEFANSFTSLLPLLNYLEIERPEIEKHDKARHLFSMRVPRPFAALMKKGDWFDPLLQQVIPQQNEFINVDGFNEDPLLEQTSATKGLLHKYLNRVLLIVKGGCAVNCRYCFRRHFPYAENSLHKADWLKVIAHIASDKNVDEVILSGGDPLMAKDSFLAWLSKHISCIPHVKRLRIHTRLPVVIPQRLNQAFLDWFTPLSMQTIIVLHINHANEISADLAQRLQRLKLAGVTLFNQSVLLRGINDNADALINLHERLFDVGVLPYYLHLLDKVKGASHFDVDEQKAKSIMHELIRRQPGYLVPKLVREIGGQPGKTPIDLQLHP